MPVPITIKHCRWVLTFCVLCLFVCYAVFLVCDEYVFRPPSGDDMEAMRSAYWKKSCKNKAYSRIVVWIEGFNAAEGMAEVKVKYNVCMKNIHDLKFVQFDTAYSGVDKASPSTRTLEAVSDNYRDGLFEMNFEGSLLTKSSWFLYPISDIVLSISYNIMPVSISGEEIEFRMLPLVVYDNMNGFYIRSSDFSLTTKNESCAFTLRLAPNLYFRLYFIAISSLLIIASVAIILYVKSVNDVSLSLVGFFITLFTISEKMGGGQPAQTLPDYLFLGLALFLMSGLLIKGALGKIDTKGQE